ncbi:hypothetical protein B0J11DRAFT_617990 [Dendryphion nanum]|uniref:D-serine dehydratase-like domain-containing protein n=1 Tax=Dendryphion nanum TaxID=256645 RepID=A0A9P9DCZ1_9PLEO|nr:hypothetical protein B0J11DRAFT_617990 [Dendryphion nanum]
MATTYSPQLGQPISTLDTPSMLVSLPLMESNITKLFSTLLPTGISIRPHLKTTKSVVLAQRLIAAGARGACVAKLSEAEVMTSLGFTDLLITCEIVGPAKVKRLVELFGRNPEVRIVVDSAAGAGAIQAEMVRSGVKGRIATLIDLDVGLHRTGVRAGEPARELARYVREECGGLKIIGVQGYEGHLQHLHGAEERKRLCLESMKVLVDTAEQLRNDGHQIDVVTTGGTGTAEFCVTVPGVTEVQPGSFLLMDTDYRNAIGRFYANSLTILSTVISKQGERIVTIDAGLKSLTTDSGLAECKEEGFVYGVLGDEHGSLEWTEEGEGNGVRKLEVGDRVEMVPSHIDPTINLHDVYYAHRDGIIEEIWKVDARGKVQ